jgi:dihydroorotase-like cyclic amidohydrolase
MALALNNARPAAEYADKAILLAPDDAEAHYVRARIYTEAGEIEQALARFDEAIALNPSNSDILVGSTDLLLYVGRTDEAIDRIEEQADAGAVAFKTFLQPPPVARRDEFVGLWATDPAVLRDVMAGTARTGIPHAFHCEDATMIGALEARLHAAGRVDALAHAESRPAVVEDASVAAILACAAEAGGPVHIVHVSSWRAAQLIASARARGLAVTAETCPHYLWLTTDTLREHGGFEHNRQSLRVVELLETAYPAFPGLNPR